MMPIFRTTATEKIERLQAELQIKEKRIAKLEKDNSDLQECFDICYAELHATRDAHDKIEERIRYFKELILTHGYDSVTQLLVADTEHKKRIVELVSSRSSITVTLINQ